MTTNKTRTIAASAVAALVILGATAVYADVSFIGKGMAFFDAITVGNNGSTSRAYIKAPIINPGTTSTGSGYPVSIADSLKIAGSTSITSNLALTGQISDSDSSSLKVGDSLYVTGNVKFDGSLYDGSTNVTTRINQNREATNALAAYVACITYWATQNGTATGDDMFYCWDTYIYGTAAADDPAVTSLGAPSPARH